MKVWLLLFVFLVAISCASIDSSFKKKRARKDVDEDQVGANKMIRLIETDNNPSENEDVEKLGIKFGGINSKENINAACIKAIITGKYGLMERLLMSYHGGYHLNKMNLVHDWNKVLVDAVAHGYEGVVKLLLERDENGQYIHKNINTGANNNEAIREATARGHEGIMKLLSATQGIAKVDEAFPFKKSVIPNLVHGSFQTLN